MTLGQSIGTIDHAFSITNDHDEKVTVSVKIDFRTASDQDIKGWLVSNRVIAGQRPWRALGKVELESMKGTVFVAQDIGRKIKSREERIQAHVNAGIPRKLAEVAIDNPEKFQAIMDEVVITEDEDDLEDE